MATGPDARLRVLMSRAHVQRFGDGIRAALAGQAEIDPVAFDPDTPPHDAFDVAYYSRDLFTGTTWRSASEATVRFFDALVACPALRWLHVFSSGIDVPVYARVLERGVTLTTSPGANAIPVATSALAGMLSIARRLPFLATAQARGSWQPIPEALWPDDLASQTIAVIGLGAIGAEIARVSGALGLQVIGVRASGASHPYCGEVHPPAALPSLAPRCHWIAIACPLTAATRGMVSRAVLLSMPRGSGLLNVGRGPIADEAAIAELLGSGHLAGAYLDVFDSEPLPPESPLWRAPNLILSPHTAAVSHQNAARSVAMFVANLQRYVAGAPLRDVARVTSR